MSMSEPNEPNEPNGPSQPNEPKKPPKPPVPRPKPMRLHVETRSLGSITTSQDTKEEKQD